MHKNLHSNVKSKRLEIMVRSNIDPFTNNRMHSSGKILQTWTIKLRLSYQSYHGKQLRQWQNARGDLS